MSFVLFLSKKKRRFVVLIRACPFRAEVPARCAQVRSFQLVEESEGALERRSVAVDEPGTTGPLCTPVHAPPEFVARSVPVAVEKP